MQDFLDAYEEHVWDVYGYLAYRIGSRTDAEDLTQVTFERALRAWERFDERKGSMRTWLLAIARNALIDHSRREGLRKHISLEDEVEAHLPIQPGAEETEIGLSPELEAALGHLRQREREVLALRFGGDLRGAEIAELLGISGANVHQILSRSLRKLRQEFEGELPLSAPFPAKPLEAER